MSDKTRKTPRFPWAIEDDFHRRRCDAAVDFLDTFCHEGFDVEHINGQWVGGVCSVEATGDTPEAVLAKTLIEVGRDMLEKGIYAC